jgi:hypothetical protein
MLKAWDLGLGIWDKTQINAPLSHLRGKVPGDRGLGMRLGAWVLEFGAWNLGLVKRFYPDTPTRYYSGTSILFNVYKLAPWGLELKIHCYGSMLCVSWCLGALVAFFVFLLFGVKSSFYLTCHYFYNKMNPM